MSISESSKHIVQIVQLLEERNMSFAFCLNKADILVLCGMTLLYQSLDLSKDSKVMKDNTKLANAVIKIADKSKAPGSLDFKRIAAMLIQVDEPPRIPAALPTPPRNSPDTCMSAPPRASPTTSHAAHNKMSASLGRHLSASMSETDLLVQQEKLRRMAIPHTSGQNRPEMYKIRSRQSFDGIRPDPLPLARRDHRQSLSHAQAAQAAMIARVSPTPNTSAKQNLDYLSFNSTPAHSQPPSPVQARSHQTQSAVQNHLYTQLAQKAESTTTAEWEALVGSLDNGQLNLYDAIYGGGLPLTEAPVSANSWSPDTWDLSNFNLGDFGTGAPTAHSVLSLSEESLSSVEDLTASSEMGLSVASLDYHHNPMIPATTSCTNSDGFILDGLEHFGL
jgi:hypothetical protein